MRGFLLPALLRSKLTLLFAAVATTASAAESVSMPDFVRRYSADADVLDRRYDLPMSSQRADRLRRFYDETLGELDKINFDALDRKLSEIMAAQGRAVLFVNDPCQNPTGYSMSAADWTATAQVIGRHAAQAPVTVLLDAAYSAYGPAGMP